ncbi:MAG: hypothetical protein U0670_21990 [Anaerolineae bacterium]
MILAAVGAAIIGDWHEGAILLFLFSLSNVLQDYAVETTVRPSRGCSSSTHQKRKSSATVKRSSSNPKPSAPGDIGADRTR